MEGRRNLSIHKKGVYIYNTTLGPVLLGQYLEHPPPSPHHSRLPLLPPPPPRRKEIILRRVYHPPPPSPQPNAINRPGRVCMPHMPYTQGHRHNQPSCLHRSSTTSCTSQACPPTTCWEGPCAIHQQHKSRRCENQGNIQGMTYTPPPPPPVTRPVLPPFPFPSRTSYASACIRT